MTIKKDSTFNMKVSDLRCDMCLKDDETIYKIYAICPRIDSIVNDLRTMNEYEIMVESINLATGIYSCFNIDTFILGNIFEGAVEIDRSYFDKAMDLYHEYMKPLREKLVEMLKTLNIPDSSGI